MRRRNIPPKGRATWDDRHSAEYGPPVLNPGRQWWDWWFLGHFFISGNQILSWIGALSLSPSPCVEVAASFRSRSRGRERWLSGGKVVRYPQLAWFVWWPDVSGRSRGVIGSRFPRGWRFWTTPSTPDHPDWRRKSDTVPGIHSGSAGRGMCWSCE